MEGSTSAATSTGTSSWRDFARRSPSDLRLVQFISDLVYGDAASTDCLRWRETFRAVGIEAPIYARQVGGQYVDIAEPLAAYRRRANDLVLFHYTTWTETADYLRERGYPIVLMYHNVTPPEFFEDFDPLAAAETRRGREQLRDFVPLTRLAVAKSEYSRRDLIEAGFDATEVLPVRVDFEALDRECNQELFEELRAGPPSLLTVGRVVPSKRIEDVVKTFAYYRARIEPTARLFVVGSHDVRGAYQVQLEWLIRRLGLGGSIRFTGQVPNADRGAYFRACRVYVSMSEHEGFGVPIVEAMHLGLPVIGYESSAVPDTMGDAGVLVREKRYDAIAEAIGLLAADTPLRARSIAKGRAQTARFAADAIEARFAAMLSGLANE